MFKVLEPSMQELQNLNYSLMKSSFCIMVLNEKYAKMKFLMLFSLLKLVVRFSITDNIVSTVNLFADDTSIFSAVNDANIPADELNKDLQEISEWF